MRGSPSSSEGALTSLRLDLPVGRGRGQPPSGSSASGPGSESPAASSRKRKGPGLKASPQSAMDAFLAHLGDPGRFQSVLMVLLASNCIPVVVNHLLMAFYAVSAPHNCRVPEDFSGNRSLYLPHKEFPDAAEARIGRRRFYRGGDPIVYEECSIYLDPDNHSAGTTQCIHGYEFHFEEVDAWNIVAEWGLVCDRSFVAPLITTVYFLGVMLGGLIFGSLADRFGRKNMMLVCLYTQCLIGIGIHFVRRLVMFIGLRFLQGIFVQGLQCVTYSMVMELFSPHYRTLAGCIVEAFWAAGIIMLALIAKYVQHWRYIQLAINIPTLATIFYIWIIPESVRWLLSRGKLKRAEEVVIRIASYNSLRLDRAWVREELDEVSRLLLLHTPERSPDIRDILGNPRIRRNAVVMFFVWFSVSLSYYGISFSIPNLSGDRYLNFMIGGGIELLAYLLAYVLLNGFGRRGPLFVYLCLSGILCIATVAVKEYIPASLIDTEGLSIGLALVGKAAVVSCFCSIFIYSSELFPTVIRTVGVGSCVCFGRIGAMAAPQILLLGKMLSNSSPQLMTFLTFGVLSIIAAFLALFLPETMDQALPDTLLDANHLGDNRPHSRHGRKRKGSHHTLLENLKTSSADSLQMQLQDEAGYGKSPEWIEVDGMIVSKGLFTNTLERKPHSFAGLPGPHHSLSLERHPSHIQVHGGSILSLPYSSRTLLTNSSRSTATTINADARYSQITEEDVILASGGDSSSENPYETLPNLKDEDTIHRNRELPPPPLPRPRFTTAMASAATRRSQPSMQRVPPPPPPPPEDSGDTLEPTTLTDESVISAAHIHGSMAIYDFIKEKTTTGTMSISDTLSESSASGGASAIHHHVHAGGPLSVKGSQRQGMLKTALLISSDLGSETRL